MRILGVVVGSAAWWERLDLAKDSFRIPSGSSVVLPPSFRVRHGRLFFLGPGPFFARVMVGRFPVVVLVPAGIGKSTGVAFGKSAGSGHADMVEYEGGVLVVVVVFMLEVMGHVEAVDIRGFLGCLAEAECHCEPIPSRVQWSFPGCAKKASGIFPSWWYFGW